jgi:hypothetical protein
MADTPTGSGANFTQVLEVQINVQDFTAKLQQMLREYDNFINKIQARSANLTVGGGNVKAGGGFGDATKSIEALEKALGSFEQHQTTVLTNLANTLTETTNNNIQAITRLVEQLKGKTVEAANATSGGAKKAADQQKNYYSKAYEDQSALYKQIVAGGDEAYNKLSDINKRWFRDYDRTLADAENRDKDFWKKRTELADINSTKLTQQAEKLRQVSNQLNTLQTYQGYGNIPSKGEEKAVSSAVTKFQEAQTALQNLQKLRLDLDKALYENHDQQEIKQLSSDIKRAETSAERKVKSASDAILKIAEIRRTAAKQDEDTSNKVSKTDIAAWERRKQAAENYARIAQEIREQAANAGQVAQNARNSANYLATTGSTPDGRAVPQDAINKAQEAAQYAKLAYEKRAEAMKAFEAAGEATAKKLGDAEVAAHVRAGRAATQAANEYERNFKKASKEVDQAIDKNKSTFQKFSKVLFSELGSLVAYTIRFSLAFRAFGAILNGIASIPGRIVDQFREGIEYISVLQQRTADIAEALATNVIFSHDFAENLRLSGVAAEHVTRKIQDLSAKFALNPEKIEAAFKSLTQSGGIEALNNDLDKAVELSAKLLSSLRSTGVNDTNQRRAIQEINDLLTGNVGKNNAIARSLHLSAESWNKIRTEALKTGTVYEELEKRLFATNARLATAGTRWADITNTVSIYKKEVQAAFAEGVFKVLIAVLQDIKKLWEENKGVIKAYFAELGNIGAEFLKAFANKQTLKDIAQLAAFVLSIGLALTKMLDELVSVARIANQLLSGNFAEADRIAAGFQQRQEAFNRAIEKSEELAYGDISVNLRNKAKSAEDEALKTARAQLSLQASTIKVKLGFLEAEPATNKQAAAVKKLRLELEHLQKQIDYIDKNNTLPPPEIIGNNPPPGNEDPEEGASRRLRVLKTAIAEEAEAIKRASEENIQAARNAETDRVINKKQASEIIIATQRRERDATISLLEEGLKKLPTLGLKPETLQAEQSVLRKQITQAHTGALKDIEAAQRQSTEEQQRIVEDGIRTEFTLQQDAIQERIAQEKQAASLGYQTEAEALAKIQQLERALHENKMAELRQERDSYAKGSLERETLVNRIRVEETKFQAESIRNARELAEIAGRDYENRLEALNRLRQSEFDVRQASIDSATSAGVPEPITRQRQNDLDNDKLKKANEDLIRATEKLRQAQLRNLFSIQVTEREMLELSAAVNEATEAQIKAREAAEGSKQKGFLEALTGLNIGALQDEYLARRKAIDGVDAQLTAMDKVAIGATIAAAALQTIQGVVSAIQQGYAQGGVLGGIGAGATAVAPLISAVSPIAGAVVGAIGAGLSVIGGLFTRAARKLAESIKRDISYIMNQFQLGNITLIQTISRLQAERAKAIRELSGKKGGKKELDKILPELDNQIAQLQKQAADIKDAFDFDLGKLRLHSEELEDLADDWHAINQQVKEYIGAGGDAAKAAEFLQLKLRNIKEQATRDLREGEQDAIKDVLRLNDLLQQRIDLVKEFKAREFDLINGDSIERRQSGAISRGQELARLREEHEKQLADLDQEITVLTKKVELEGQVFDINKDIADLRERDTQLQLEALDEEIKRWKDIKTIVDSIYQNEDGQLVLGGDIGETLEDLEAISNKIIQNFNNLQDALDAKREREDIGRDQYHGYATGGVVYRREIVEVAEKGPEAIIPLEGGRSVPVTIKTGTVPQRLVQTTNLTALQAMSNFFRDFRQQSTSSISNRNPLASMLTGIIKTAGGYKKQIGTQIGKVEINVIAQPHQSPTQIADAVSQALIRRTRYGFQPV